MFYLGLLLFFVVCCGEEISWGQRIFNLAGPSFIIDINKQHEINLHDIGHISIYSNIFFILFLCMFFIYPYFMAKNAKFKKFILKHYLAVVNYEIMKIAFLTLITWIIIGIRFGTLGFSPLTLFDYYTQMDDEVFECLSAFTYFAFVTVDLYIKSHGVFRALQS